MSYSDTLKWEKFSQFERGYKNSKPWKSWNWFKS